MTDLMLRRRELMVSESVPYDAKIEYLQATGTQFIEIPFGFYNTDEVYIRASLDIDMDEDKFLVCANRWNDNRNRFGMVGRSRWTLCFAYGSRETNVTSLQPYTYNDGEFHNWVYKNYKCNVTDLQLSLDVNNIAFGGETTNLRLFYGYNANTSGKIAYYKQVKNGVVVIDLIPVRIGNKGYMYDKVNKTLFGNAGTGDFILGNDI